MAYLVLARKYRSQTFDDVVGQKHVADTLKKAIESGRISHAYLFAGTRGTGKTSMARILAKALNCESSDKPTPVPCGKCNSCKSIADGNSMSVIEIDAASNTQVEKTREVIIDNASYRTAGRYRIYIIDEAHMLSKQSFNALLKTLEEPPSHVVFILATTEPEKLLPTILSRCQRYDFRNIPTREIAGHLKKICDDEGVQFDQDAILLVAKAGAGSMRDALSLLDRLLSSGEKKLTVELMEQMLGIPRIGNIFDLVALIGGGDVKGVLEKSTKLIADGLSPEALVTALTDYLRNLLIITACGPQSDLLEVPGISTDELASQAARFDSVTLSQDIAILEELRRNLRGSQTARALLDATMVRLTLANQFVPIDTVMEPAGSDASNAAPALKKNVEPPLTPAPQLKASVAVRDSNVEPVSNSDLSGVWNRLLSALSDRGPGLPPLLAPATLVGIDQGSAVIRYPHGHESMIQMLDRSRHKDTIQDELSRMLSRPVALTFELDGEPEAPSHEIPPPTMESPRPAPQRAPAPVAVRITAELREQLRSSEPLIRAVMDQLGGEIVRVE
ncbi:MAG: DNA polymerase III subunit gamma/tau [Tepidisphaeraceae bacterium]